MNAVLDRLIQNFLRGALIVLPVAGRRGHYRMAPGLVVAMMAAG